MLSGEEKSAEYRNRSGVEKIPKPWKSIEGRYTVCVGVNLVKSIQIEGVYTRQSDYKR